MALWSAIQWFTVGAEVGAAHGALSVVVIPDQPASLREALLAGLIGNPDEKKIK